MKIKDIVFREDLYPRFEPNQAQIQKYSDSVDQLPPIKVNQQSILIDGFHRWKAFQVAGYEEIPAETVETESEKELKKLAYQLNSNHGLQLSNEEKKRYAQEMYGDMNVKALHDVLGVSEKTIHRWTKTQAKAAKEERDRRIIELYLRAWNTQQSIADVLELDSKQTVSNIVDVSKKGHLSDFGQTFQPYLYNIWNTPKGDEGNNHFGAFPSVFMENLLYYHTEPLDIVFDPFAGGGTTVDVCKRMFRRYYASDLNVIPGREKEIKKQDIADGLPEDLQKPDLVFLDPPYWKQAEGKYSNSKSDLGNMTEDNFNKAMNQLFQLLTKRNVEQIALVIQPTQYKNNWRWTDHVFDFDKMLEKYRIAARYILPYSTEQYLPQMVNKAKESRICLGTHRDLIVWRRK